MLETLNRPVFGPVTLLHLAVLFVVVLFVLPRAAALFGPKKEDPTEKMRVDKQCMSCGWAGRVSMHNARCPKCNKSLS